MKQEACGWPTECQTEEAKADWIKDYGEHEHIKLEPHKISKNSGKRQVAKLMLSSFWGKF